jgi:hypothetical protein
MIRTFCLILLGLSLCATLSMAQVPDSVTVPAALPRTEAEFLARYGASDSNRYLIRYVFKRKHRAVVGSFASAVGVGVGTGLFSYGIAAMFSKNISPTAGGVLAVGGLGLQIAGTINLISSSFNWRRFNRARLQRVLEGQDQYDPLMMRRVDEFARGQADKLSSSN